MLTRIFLSMLLALAALPFSALAASETPTTIRVGILEFGTVGWELDVMQAHQLAKRRGIDLKIVPLGSNDASAVALQGGAVDVIVSDWIWVSRQRASSNRYSFAPYSNAVGALMVKADGEIRQLADLRGKKIGVGGGPADKTWLLLRAYAQRTLGADLAQYAQPAFAAPPLLNELALRGQVDAALNPWHYAARLNVAGMRPLIDVPQILKGLGIPKPIPLIGWVFREDWANANQAALRGFLDASYEAKALLAGSDAEWDRLRPRMRAENDAVFIALRTQFRAGIPSCAAADVPALVAATYKILADTGGEKLTGSARAVSAGTFWSGFALPPCSAQ